MKVIPKYVDDIVSTVEESYFIVNENDTSTVMTTFYDSYEEAVEAAKDLHKKHDHPCSIIKRIITYEFEKRV